MATVSPYMAGFMRKCAEVGVPKHVVNRMLKQAVMPGMQKMRDVRRLVNLAIAARKSVGGKSVKTHKALREILQKNPSFKPTFYAKAGPGPGIEPIVGGTKGFPRYAVYRGEALPGYSTGGQTSSSVLRNSGPQIGHITPSSSLAMGYGGGPVLVYNAKKVPGLMNGSLRFGSNNSVERNTARFTDMSGLFGPRRPEQVVMKKQLLDTRKPSGINLEFLGGGIPTTEGSVVKSMANKAGLGYEAGIDMSRVKPSRVIRHNGLGEGYDVTNLYAYADAQRRLLPDGIDVEDLIIEGIPRTFTPAQAKAAKRYIAVSDILRSLDQ